MASASSGSSRAREDGDSVTLAFSILYRDHYTINFTRYERKGDVCFTITKIMVKQTSSDVETPFEVAAQSMSPLSSPNSGAIPATEPLLAEGCSPEALFDEWLSIKKDGNNGLRPNTVSQYALEGRRLRWFAALTGKPFQHWEREDAKRYLATLRSPPPGALKANAGRNTDDWRPLRGPLSASSLRQSRLIAGGFFNWLVDVGVLLRNPFASMDNPVSVSGPEVPSRALSSLQLDAVFEAISRRPAEAFWDRIRAARDRMVITLAFRTGLRASELVRLVWTDFEQRQGPQGAYWTILIPTPNKATMAPVRCDAAMEEIARFRRTIGLSPEPRSTDNTAVIPAIPGGKRLAGKHHDSLSVQRLLRRPVTTRQGLYVIVRRAFSDAKLLLLSRGHVEQATGLNGASTHWLRYSAAVHLLKEGQPAATVQRFMRLKGMNAVIRQVDMKGDDEPPELDGDLALRK